MSQGKTYAVDSINLSAFIGTNGSNASISISGYLIDECGNIEHCKDIALTGPNSLDTSVILAVAKEEISDSITSVSIDFDNDELAAFKTAYSQF